MSSRSYERLSSYISHFSYLYLTSYIVQCHINQHAELSMVNAQYSCKVARLVTQDGCPLQPGGNINKTVVLKPLAQNCHGIRGLCLDASLSKVTDESNLASSR